MPASPNAMIWLILMLLVLILCPPALAQSDQSDGTGIKLARVYILAGQSNMAGSGQGNQLAEMWQQPVEGALIYQGGAFKTLTAGNKGRFGPELGFAHYLVNNHPNPSRIFIIKFALSGQPLDAGWNGGAADGSSWVSPEPGPNRKTFYPGMSPDDPNMGLHYKKMAAHISAAMKKLAEDGYHPELQGIVWMQGEQDAKNKVSAGRYDRSLALLKRRLQDDFNRGNEAPFVFGQILPHEPAMDRFTHRDLIRQRMAEADNRSGSDRAVKGVWMVPTEGMQLLKDTVHYSTKGQLALGQAFGLEVLKAHRAANE